MSTLKTNQLAHTANGSSVYTLPQTDGSANQLLKTDGSGNLGWATDQGGKILQVVQNVTTTRTATSSFSFVATAALVTITPTVASSKILINFTCQCNTQDINRALYLTVYRSINGGTYENIAPQGSGQTFGSSTNLGFLGLIRGSHSRIQVPFHINYLDTPSYSVGNAIVYKLYTRSLNSNEIEIPAGNNAEPIVSMATEIAA